MDAPGRVAKLLGEDVTPDEFPLTLEQAAVEIRRAYAQGYLDAPLPDPDVLQAASEEQAEAWARLPVPG